MIEQLTPKQKAKELIKKFYQPIFNIDFGVDVSKDEKRYKAAKECAELAVDEILSLYWNDVNGIVFWQEVKQEIINYQE